MSNDSKEVKRMSPDLCMNLAQLIEERRAKSAAAKASEVENAQLQQQGFGRTAGALSAAASLAVAHQFEQQQETQRSRSRTTLRDREEIRSAKADMFALWLSLTRRHTKLESSLFPSKHVIERIFKLFPTSSLSISELRYGPLLPLLECNDTLRLLSQSDVALEVAASKMPLLRVRSLIIQGRSMMELANDWGESGGASSSVREGNDNGEGGRINESAIVERDNGARQKGLQALLNYCNLADLTHVEMHRVMSQFMLARKQKVMQIIKPVYIKRRSLLRSMVLSTQSYMMHELAITMEHFSMMPCLEDMTLIDLYLDQSHTLPPNAKKDASASPKKSKNSLGRRDLDQNIAAHKKEAESDDDDGNDGNDDDDDTSVGVRLPSNLVRLRIVSCKKWVSWLRLSRKTKDPLPLRSLCLELNNLDDGGAIQVLSDGFDLNVIPHLTHLSLSGNRLKLDPSSSTSPSWAAFLFSHTPKLHSLDLSKQKLAAANIASLIGTEEARGLVSLNIGHCMDDVTETKKVLVACKRHPTLRKLDVTCSAIDGSEVRHVANVIQEWLDRDAALQLLQHNMHQPSQEEETATAAAAATEDGNDDEEETNQTDVVPSLHHHHLHHHYDLAIGGNRIAGASVVPLQTGPPKQRVPLQPNFLAMLRHLKRLDLSRCDLGSDGVITLLAAFDRAMAAVATTTAPSNSHDRKRSPNLTAEKKSKGIGVELFALNLSGNNLDSRAMGPIIRTIIKGIVGNRGIHQLGGAQALAAMNGGKKEDRRGLRGGRGYSRGGRGRRRFQNRSAMSHDDTEAVPSFDPLFGVLDISENSQLASSVAQLMKDIMTVSSNLREHHQHTVDDDASFVLLEELNASSLETDAATIKAILQPLVASANGPTTQQHQHLPIDHVRLQWAMPNPNHNHSSDAWLAVRQFWDGVPDCVKKRVSL